LKSCRPHQTPCHPAPAAFPVGNCANTP